MSYRELLARQPDLPDDWFNLGWLLRQQGDGQAALQAYAEALRRGVSGPEEVHLNRAVIFNELLRDDAAAESELRQALALAPRYLPALLNLGNLHEELGRRAEAIDCYRQLLDRCAGAGPPQYRLPALARLAHLVPPADVHDPALRALEAAAQQSDAAIDDRVAVLFALGRACDHLGLRERAFAAFAAANALAATQAPRYDPGQAERQTAAIIDTFPRPEPQRPNTRNWRTPLFIIGMFRSGSTLLEQVLAGHPAMHPGGEIEFLPRLMKSELHPFPLAVRELVPAQFGVLAERYGQALHQQFGAALAAGRWLTDKRPDNWRLVGLIKRMFPDARFVNTVRDPRDIGLSIWTQHLDLRQLPHASDLAAIGHHQGEYRRLLAHWRTLYPTDICDFDYDAFVRAPRETLEPLLQWLGLSWHEDCLAFHARREHSVRTASYWQVRRPLYGEASGRWRHYAEYLQPLLTALDRAGVRVDPLTTR